MDVVLGHPERWIYARKRVRLNPCFNGCGSRTSYEWFTSEAGQRVSILVLMDVVLGHYALGLDSDIDVLSQSLF